MIDKNYSSQRSSQTLKVASVDIYENSINLSLNSAFLKDE